MKKLFLVILSLALIFSVFCGCNVPAGGGNGGSGNGGTGNETGREEDTELKEFALSADGYATDKIGDFSIYENTPAYRKVKTAEELAKAILDAKCHYKNVWDDETGTYSQVPADGYTEENFLGSVHVIEIENDLNLGYYKLSEEVKRSGVVNDFAKDMQRYNAYLSNSSMALENGISQFKVENTSDLLIYSKNGATLTHCGFKLTSDNNVVFRNLQFDEMWQWEDALVNGTNKIGDYDWYGWAYFKISFCGYIWIDHCTFGKSFDGQIDYSNPDYTANAGVAFRAPYGADGGNGLNISWCDFRGGSDDPEGYLYKMMTEIEENYGNGGTDYLYYNALRNAGASFEDILYGLAIPQKKGFLCGDSGNNKEDYEYNLKLQVSFSHCRFKNIEDRLPKLRGGNACMYNCVIDNTQYMTYRNKLKSYNAAGAVAAVNSSWKCALVSQGIVCGNGGSFYGENCIYRAVDTLLKNNDSNASPKVDGGYKLVNCSYLRGSSGTPYIGSSSDAGNLFINSSANILNENNFRWHTQDGTQPFTVPAVELGKLEEHLSNAKYGSGAKTEFKISLLKSKY